MKTMIAIPCGDEVPYMFAESLLALIPVGDTTVRFLSGSLIYEARNRLMDAAIEGGYDYILWLDSDIVFEPDLMQRLFEGIGDRDMITGVYYTRRRKPYTPTIFSKVRYVQSENYVSTEAAKYFEFPKDEIFEIEGCGFGCVLLKVSMCEYLRNRSGLPFTPLPGFGEDLSFCYRARQLGYKLYCDGKIRVGHIGKTVIEVDEWYQQPQD